MLSATDIAMGYNMSKPSGMPPAGYLLSGEDMSQTSAEATKGIDSNDFVVDIVDVPLTGLRNVNFGVFLRSLAEGTTVFGSFNAKVVSGQLELDWSTLSELNTQHFEIEVSNDNINFVSIASVAGKAIGGNSKTQLNYTFSSAIGNVFSVLSISAFFLLALPVFKKRHKMKLIALLIFASLIGLRCNKKDIALSKKLFIRIAHIDKNGGKTYSRTVQLWVNYP